MLRALAVAAVAAGCAPVSDPPGPPAEVIKVNLDTVAERRGELDGRWVEFDGFVYRLAEPSLLIAVPGRQEVSTEGVTRMRCRGTPESNLPVVLKGGLGPLPRDALRTADRQPRVTIRAVFRNSTFTAPAHLVSPQWPAHADQGTIVAVHDEWCDLY